jgi:signal transduction histidine kinase
VFEKFVRGNDSHPGSGLGMAIAKGIVNAHGGEISIEDRPNGTGTAVVFTLPVVHG